MAFWRFALSSCVVAISLSRVVAAASTQDARVTALVKDVRLFAPDASSRPASLSDLVKEGTEVRTGADSRAEITLTDQTIARFGSNSAFNFKDGNRSLNLSEGAILVQAPERSATAKIETSSVAASIRGTTVVFEYHPTSYKFLVLNGTGRLYRPGHLGDSVLVQAGQMVFGKSNAELSDPVDFDIGRFVKTCRFIVDFRPLPSEKLIASEAGNQQRAKSKKVLLDTNLFIFGRGTSVSLVDPGTNASGPGTPAVTSTQPGVSSSLPESAPSTAGSSGRQQK
jgi:FecR protein